MGVALIFATGLDHMFMHGVVGSYDDIAPGAAPPVGDAAESGARRAATSFRVGFQIAMPVIAAGLIFRVGLGVLSRLIPQIQVFFVALPLQIMGGFVVIALGLIDRHADLARQPRTLRDVAEVSDGDATNDDKTEEPTPRKLEQAREKGDIVYSPEVGAALSLIALTAIVAFMSGPIARDGAQLHRLSRDAGSVLVRSRDRAARSSP